MIMGILGTIRDLPIKGREGKDKPICLKIFWEEGGGTFLDIE